MRKRIGVIFSFIFISYSSNDRELVQQDVLEFQRRGYNVWLDERNLDKAKSSWKEDALKAIQNYNSILLIFYVSRHSLTSEACYNELNETMSEITKGRHRRRELKFIAVEAEPIGDMLQFADEVDSDLRITSKDTQVYGDGPGERKCAELRQKRKTRRRGTAADGLREHPFPRVQDAAHLHLGLCQAAAER